MHCPPSVSKVDGVAPHWGAWIEIRRVVFLWCGMLSHPTGVRGLKFVHVAERGGVGESHPTGVRGLKYPRDVLPGHANRSHPTGVRGLKFVHVAERGGVGESHPTGVRGLKYPRDVLPGHANRSHPTGVRGLKYQPEQPRHIPRESHPTGVRGLKSQLAETRQGTRPVAPHWGAWIEMNRRTRSNANA